MPRGWEGRRCRLQKEQLSDEASWGLAAKHFRPRSATTSPINQQPESPGELGEGPCGKLRISAKSIYGPEDAKPQGAPSNEAKTDTFSPDVEKEVAAECLNQETDSSFLFLFQTIAGVVPG